MFLRGWCFTGPIFFVLNHPTDIPTKPFIGNGEWLFLIWNHAKQFRKKTGTGTLVENGIEINERPAGKRPVEGRGGAGKLPVPIHQRLLAPNISISILVYNCNK